ncbi:MAG: phosphoribosylformylglycinamidine cyclo-ligase, partial [Phycisphaerales bacterium]
MSKYISYEESGVNIDANDEMVRQIQSAVAGTFGPRVIQSHNAFAGMFRLDYDERLFKRNYKNPVLVACTDGVGSKVQLAGHIKKFDTVGIDLVAMNVNDMLVQGAEPLFFLDYLAVHKLEPKIIAELVKGVASGCRQADCALIGGETAEMPDTYAKGDFDMAGFAVGVIERKKIITGETVRSGDVVLGLASTGLHSNGYTLARNICFKQAKLKMTDVLDELGGAMLGNVLLEPTRIYARPIVKLLSQYKVKRIVHGMAHITGGGLPGNIPRVLPKDCNAVIKKSSWPRYKIFSFLQNTGPVEEEEMYRVFNMGIGFVLIVAE